MIKTRRVSRLTVSLTAILLLGCASVSLAQANPYPLPADLAMPLAYHHHPLFRFVFYDPMSWTVPCQNW